MLKIIFGVLTVVYLVLTIYAFASNKPKKTKISAVILTIVWAVLTGVMFVTGNGTSDNQKQSIALDYDPIVFDNVEISPTKLDISGITATFYFSFTNTENTETSFNGTGVAVTAEQNDLKLTSNYEDEMENVKGQLYQKIDPNTDLEIDLEYTLKNDSDPITFSFSPLEGKTKTITVDLK